MLVHCEALKTFTDYDGVVIPAGTVLGEVVKRGPANGGGVFYNTVMDGIVTSVTLGYPPVVEVSK